MRTLAMKAQTQGEFVEQRGWSDRKPRTIVGFTETPSHYLVRFDMPEFLGDDVRVEIRNGELVVRGRDRWEDEDSARHVSLRLDADRQGVFARYKDGILIVALPKADNGCLLP